MVGTAIESQVRHGRDWNVCDWLAAVAKKAKSPPMAGTMEGFFVILETERLFSRCDRLRIAGAGARIDIANHVQVIVGRCR